MRSTIESILDVDSLPCEDVWTGIHFFHEKNMGEDEDWIKVQDGSHILIMKKGGCETWIMGRWAALVYLPRTMMSKISWVPKMGIMILERWLEGAKTCERKIQLEEEPGVLDPGKSKLDIVVLDEIFRINAQEDWEKWT